MASQRGDLSKLGRPLEIVITVIAALVLSPVYLLVALLVRLFLGSPVIFRDLRLGRGGRQFLLYKFRTMSEESAAGGALLPDAQRLGAFGRCLRATSMDELPQLWNVIRGDMCLVGPRPLLPAYGPRYTERQRRRHEVRPGITGWAQVHGRNSLTWEQKFDLDIWYVDHRSLWLDLRILALTLAALASRKDIHQPGHATMPEFKGEI